MKHVLMTYKNFSQDTNISHVGLGVTAQYTAKSLTHAGYFAQAKPIYGADDLSQYLEKSAISSKPVTHVIIMAQWIPTRYLAGMVRQFPEVKFALNCHSNCGFLQAEPPAIDLVRQAIDLETGTTNFHMACNNIRLVSSLQAMYGRPITYLPNLYWLHGNEPIHRPAWNGGMLRIGAFGSLRVYKNFSTAIAAAVLLTSQLKCHSEIWINGGRHDGDGNVVQRTAMSWTKGLPNVQLKQLHWASWPEFKRTIGSMNIHLQPSFTETFNNCVADGIVEGTPSVVSEAIEWCPESWKAQPDDAMHIASVGRRLLFDPHAAQDGYQALQSYQKVGLPYWREFLETV